MSIIAKINNIFPSLEDIPPEFQLKSSIEQREYLINGTLQLWNGEMEESLSPIYIKRPFTYVPKIR